MKNKTTQKRKPHRITKKTNSEKNLQRIICSGKKTSEMIEDLHKAFPHLEELQKQETELFFMQRTLDAVQQIKHNLNVLKTIAGIGDEK